MSIGLHGLAEFQIIHDSVGLNNNRFDTATIPVDGGQLINVNGQLN